MPAAQLARLRSQIQELSFKLTQPEVFAQSLLQLLDFYGDQIHQNGKEVTSASRLPAGHIPVLVLNELTLGLGRLAQANPLASLTAAETLWSIPHYETRLLAGQFLGQIPVIHAEHVIETIEKWCRPDDDRAVIDEMIRNVGTRLRNEEPQRWLALMQFWLLQKDAFHQTLALEGLIPLIEENGARHLPAVFSLLETPIKSPSQALQADLLNILQTAAECSPVETASFLAHLLQESDNASTSRLVRRLLPSFDPPTQARLPRPDAKPADFRAEMNSIYKTVPSLEVRFACHPSIITIRIINA